jgi:predicted HTH transcriptional regulator
MKNTAIEELIEYFQNTANVTFTGDKVVDYSISKLYYLQTIKFMRELKAKKDKALQAKHEEELKQAVVDAYVKGVNDFGSDDGTELEEAEQYYEANFNTKEL